MIKNKRKFWASFELIISWDDEQVCPSGQTEVFANFDDLLKSSKEHGFTNFEIEENDLVSRQNGNRAIIQLVKN